MRFLRGRGGHKGEDEAPRASRHAARRRERDEFGPDPAADRPERTTTTGPYDLADAPDGVGQVDLGSLHIPYHEGVDLGIQADQDGQITHVVLVHGDNRLELAAFAAPRTEGVWDEIRADIRAHLPGNAIPKEIDGEYGVELKVQLATEDGPVDLRFVGVDGPRWMIRGVYRGAAAADPEAAALLAECLRGVVVDRGSEAMPVRDPLPLRLPRGEISVSESPDEGVSQAATQAATQAPKGAGTSRRSKPSTRSRRRG